MIRTRMVWTAVLIAAAFAQAACDEAPPVEVRSTPSISPTPRITPSATTLAAAPRPLELSKPPVLGPTSPALVLLPDRIAEPQIRVRLTDEKATPPAVNGTQYRGSVQVLRLANGKYVAVNTLPLDSYVQGVLTGEIPGSWDAATFRAQAIAARTFALFQISTDGRDKAWDVSADTSSQMYGGIKAENEKARLAVDATRGQVLMTTFNGQTGIFCSFYSSCIGGASQDPFDAWGDPSIAPLAAHVTGAVDDNSTKFKWDHDFVISKAEVTRCVQNWGTRNSFPHLTALTRIEAVTITKRNATTGRPTQLTLVDAAGKSAPIRAEEFRLALMNDPLGRAPKPYSSNCDVRVQGDSVVLYNGHGYGHGIGMSQWGAQNLAKKGYGHAQILAYFYPHSTVKSLW